MIPVGPGIQRRAIHTEQAASSVDQQGYRVVLPLGALDERGDLLDWVIDYAFDTLDVRHLDLRIVAATDIGE